MENNELRITDDIKATLLSASKWVKLMAVVGAVSMAVLVLAAIAMCFLKTAENTLIAVVYIVMALIYIYPLKKLFNIVSATRTAMTEDSQAQMEEAVKSVHALVKFFGVLTIITLCIYAIGLLAVVAGVAVSGLS